MSRKEAKLLAKEKLKNNWELGILSLVLCEVFMFMAFIFTLGMGDLVIVGPLLLGLFMIYESFIYNRDADWRMLLEPFKERFADSFIVGLVLCYAALAPALGIVFILLGAIVSSVSLSIGSQIGYGFAGIGGMFVSFGIKVLFIVIAVIVVWVLFYCYSEALVILLREKDTKGFAALKKSRTMMKGRKFSLFVFDLSFVGWWILVSLTAGLAGFYVVPYFLCSRLVMMDSIYKDCENIDFSIDETSAD